ncbi:hypothetical protein BHE74_00023042 [Ensete ventricosum]|nr:hypothetical protein BHE74_00023042 [Ensete ventricosum]
MPVIGQQKKDFNIIDPDAYTIVSEEAIDAKLEAFENRMEEKMHPFSSNSALADRRARGNHNTEKLQIGTFIEGLKPEIRGEAKERQPYTLMAVIFFARIQEEQLNREVRRTRVTPQLAMSRPTTLSTAIQAPAPKKLTRDELRKRSTKELCWHFNKPWSHEHHYKKGQLLVIERVEDEDNETSEKALEPKEEAMEEESPPANYAVHALADYSIPLMMKVGGLLKQQPITILIDMGSTNNFLNSKVAARLALQIKSCNKFDVKVTDGRIFNCD